MRMHIQTPKVKEKPKKSSLIKKTKVSGKPTYDSVLELIQCLIPAMSQFRYFRLTTNSGTEHKELKIMMSHLCPKIDSLAEQYILCCGELPSYEGHEYFKTVDELLHYIKEKIYDAHCDHKGINNVISEISEYMTITCYKLNQFK